MNDYKVVTGLRNGVMLIEEVYQKELADKINSAIKWVSEKYPSCELIDVITFYKDSSDKVKTQYTLIFKKQENGIRKADYEVDLCVRMQMNETIEQRDANCWDYQECKQVSYQQYLLIFSKKSEQALDRELNMD